MEKYTVTVDIEEFMGEDDVAYYRRTVKVGEDEIFSHEVRKDELSTDDRHLGKFHRWVDYLLHPEHEPMGCDEDEPPLSEEEEMMTRRLLDFLQGTVSQEV